MSNVACGWLTLLLLVYVVRFVKNDALEIIIVIKYVRMKITLFLFSWGGITSDIRSDIMFYGCAYASP